MKKIFNNDYDKLINEILDKRDLLSGIHAIDSTKAELWINNQSTERRRQAARNLLDNTYYISFNKTFELMRNVIIQLYEKLKEEDNIYLWVGIDKKSSQYFMSLIALYFIRLLRYKEPLIIMNLHDNLQYLKKAIVINCDDCSYSGNQSQSTSEDLYQIMKKNQKYLKKYYLCFCVVSEYSLINLNDKILLNWVKCIYGMKIPLLKDNFERFSDYMDLYYYFSPYTEEGTPPICCYFDHKISVSNSTFSYILNGGFILPSHLDYDNLNNKIDYYMIYFYGRKNLLGKAGLDFRNEVILQYLSDMEEDEGYGNEYIESIPVISNYETVIDPRDISYYTLMTGFNDFNPLDPKYEDLIDKLNNSNGCAIKCFYKTLKYT